MTSSEEIRKCTRCIFEGPLKDWKLIKGVPTKWCERCRAWSCKKEQTIKEEKRAQRIEFYEHLNGPMGSGSGGGTGVEACRRIYVEHCIREGIDIEKADARRERQHEARMKKWSQCPDCHKEMQISSIARHQANACKAVVPAVEVSPLINPTIAPAT